MAEQKVTIRMRKYRPQDIYFLFENSNYFNLPHMDSINCDLTFIKRFEYSLRTCIHDFFIFENIDELKPIGFIYSYDFRLYDVHCYFDYYLQMEGGNDTLVKKFIDEMFCEYALNKLFTYVSEFQVKKQNMLKKLGFYKEAILKEYKFESGKYVDMYIYSYERKGEIFMEAHNE